jgi:hypothetical protein
VITAPIDGDRILDVVVQIVPLLPPSLSGVGDYALYVARALFDKWGIHSRFVVCDPSWLGSREIDGFPVVRVAARTPQALCDALAAVAKDGSERSMNGTRTIALLQHSAYGYERNGCPFWLARGLRDWKEGDTPGSRILLTMFHELYAMSTPWRKAFWVSAFQRKVLKDINSITDVRMTNMAKYAAYLSRQGFGGIKIDALLNTPSNVGELEKLLPFVSRATRLAVFGSGKSRKQIYRSARDSIMRFVENYGVQEIIDIGAPLGPFRTPDLGCATRSTGILSAPAVSKELARCGAGVVWYSPADLGKSGVYAAYCAHGLAPLVAGRWKRYEYSGDGLEEGKHFLYLDRVASWSNSQLVKGVAEEAHDRYRGHDVSRHAAYIAKLLEVGASPVVDLLSRSGGDETIRSALRDETGSR